MKPSHDRGPFKRRKGPKPLEKNQPSLSPSRSLRPSPGVAPAPASARPPAPSESAPTHWGNVAEWYDQLIGQEGSEYQQEVVHPGILRLLALHGGERVLDIACGQGVLCRLMLNRNAKVTGIDASDRLLEMAKERSDPRIAYLVADARNLARREDLPPATFDAAVCALAIQDLDPIPPVFDGVARLLKPAGRFVLVMNHPCFRIPKASSWGWDEKAKTQFRRIDRYMLPSKEQIITNPGRDQTRYTWAFHRPLQAYVRALARAGLLIDALEEWTSHKSSDSGPRAVAENTARRQIPIFLALRTVKSTPPLEPPPTD